MAYVQTRRKMNVGTLGVREWAGYLKNKGQVVLSVVDGAFFLYDSLQDFTPVKLPSGITSKGMRRWLCLIYEGTDVIGGYCDIVSAAETLGADLAVQGAFAADADWVKGNNWAIAGGKATKTAGDQTELVASADIAGTVGKMYKMTCKVADMTAGFLQVNAGSQILGQIKANGTYTYYWTNALGNFKPTFTSNTTFDGSLDDVVVKEVTSGPASGKTIKLFDSPAVGSMNMIGALAGKPVAFDLGGTFTYKIIPVF